MMHYSASFVLLAVVSCVCCSVCGAQPTARSGSCTRQDKTGCAVEHLLLQTRQATRQTVGTSLLVPISTARPDESVFQPNGNIYLRPGFTDVQGPKQTNKFWTNWVVAERGDFKGEDATIFPMPYALYLGCDAGKSELFLSHGKPNYVRDTARVPENHYRYYITSVVGEIGLGAVEPTSSSGHRVIEESLFGVHLEFYGQGDSARKITFPVYAGGAYLSGRYQGGFTPRVTSSAARALTEVECVSDGIWRFSNNAGKSFRVYLLMEDGELCSCADYHFTSEGVLNQPLEGWVRIAEEQQPGDAMVLDAHAQAVVTGIALEVPAAGHVRYAFSKVGKKSVKVLHYAFEHHLKLLEASGRGFSSAHGLSRIQAPTKGLMTGIIGDKWNLWVDTGPAATLAFLPLGDLSSERKDDVAAEALSAMETFQGTGWHSWKHAMFRGDYYFSGKGYQKLGTVCLILEKLLPEHEKLKECIDILEHGFRCLYEPTAVGDCDNAPKQAYYDNTWGGIVSSEGFEGDEACHGWADFGNACYNDHHYHFGYFVTSAAILAKLRPSTLESQAFIDYVNTLIRDTTNPSAADPLFPQFRSFDWFNLHSWSRGVAPNRDGKDQESTSEELNLLYGIHLWGNITGNTELKQLGETMLALDAVTIKEFFLMKTGNPHHHPDFVRNHVTGIFFENKVDYTTWFGSEKSMIHGIQMLPLSPALQLTRTQDFCQQEWDDILQHEKLERSDKWTSIVFTGNLAMHDPDRAYEELRQMHATDAMDDGLTKAWAMYWAAVLAAPTRASWMPMDGGEDRACRGLSEADNSHDHFKVVMGVASLDECKQHCKATSECVGIEHNKILQRCEIWTRIGGIQASHRNPGYWCLRYVSFALPGEVA